MISALAFFIYRASYFGLYDTSKIFIGKDPKILFKFAIAQAVVSVSGLISYPLDTVRRRLMLQSGKKGFEVQYTNSLDCFVKIFAQEGLRGFFKGAVSNFFRGIGGSMVLVLYDELRRLIDPNAKPSAE